MKELKLNMPHPDNFMVQEAYKFLRTNLQFCGRDVKVINITSCYENEGKSTISLNIAKSFSELGKKTILIDADMRKSVLAGKVFGTRDRHGLSEYLSGLATLDDSIIKTSVENLYVMFSGKYPPNPTELIDSQTFSELITQLKEMFDYVIVDTPPLGAVIDAAVIAAKSDGTLLVVGGEKLNAKTSREVVDQLRKSGGKILGVVRNNIKIVGKDYYYKKKYRY